MKKVILTAPYTFEYAEAPIPEITDDQVLLKVRQIGICASDMQMYHGLHKFMTYPVVVGHEAAATIEKVGANVKDYKVGDNVTVEPQVFCGECYPCRIGRFNVCEHLKVMGVHRDGFACEYFAIDPKYLHACEGLTTDETTLIEPLAVGVGSARRAGDLHGKNVVVVGAGTIGNLVAQSAKALGAEKVMVTDIKDNTIVITGNFKAPVEVFLPVLQRQEISLLGHMMYVREHYQEAIAAVREKRVNLSGFATQHFDFDNVNEAFKFVDENPDDVMKAMIRI